MATILAFETSCDDTCVAVLRDGSVLHEVCTSQTAAHAAYGGIVPEVAARLHADRWPIATRKVLEAANVTLKDIDALAVTVGPGLSTSLLTGAVGAGALSVALNLPLVPVHHIYGHIVSAQIGREPLPFPALVLTLSGGHTQIYYAKSWCDVTLIASTRDDAAGECFDKVARGLNLPQPGGPSIAKAAVNGNTRAFTLPKPLCTRLGGLDFSFSGLKAACLRVIEQQTTLTNQFVADMAASMQQTVADIVTYKAKAALKQYPEAQNVWLVGGVSANTVLYAQLNEKLAPLPIVKPQKIAYATDNASMIGFAAEMLLKKHRFAPHMPKIKPRWSLSDFFAGLEVR